MNDRESGNGRNDGFKPGNTDADGKYVVGKNRPPEHGKFRKGDGRPRGRRKKGTKNLATDFREELASKITLKVDGKPKRVSKQRAVMMRLMDNASRGQTPAIKLIMEFAARFGIELLVADEPAEVTEYKFMHLLTDYEMELLGLILAKAGGEDPQSLLKKDKLYEPGDPLAYLDNPEDPRNFDIEITSHGVSWRRYHGVRTYTDRIVGVSSDAYRIAAAPRPCPQRFSLEIEHAD